MTNLQSSTADLTEQMAAARRQIDAALDRYTDFSADCPSRLREAIRYSLLAPGKRLRPMLVLFAAEACGSNSGAAIPAACAIEMVHTYSLIHDDLPAMDDDDLRRGRPTCHKAFGEAVAILAGDALLALEFSTGDVATLENIHRRKTGAMFVASLKLAGYVAGADAARQGALERFGRKIGLAFQIADDLLDVQGDESALGKRVGKDSKHGKMTFPSLLGIEESQLRAQRLIDEACMALKPLGEKRAGLEALARYVLERKH